MPIKKLFFGYLTLWFLLIYSNTKGQSSPNPYPVFDTKNMLPTSPDAAILGRFGDIPIGYYTGTADVSIPLYTIKEAGLDIPIVLRYHGSGIKVEDQASMVGLGWSLEPGGSIIQVVNGTEDQMDQLVTADPTGYAMLKSYGLALGEYSGRPIIGYNSWGCNPVVSPADSYETIYRLLIGDGQPDIYIFNFAGFSGKFYINPETHQVVQLNKKDSITFSYSAWQWTATTMDGDQFIFSALENSTTYIVSDHTGFTFKLSRIILHNGKTISFQYAPGYYSWYTYSETYHTYYRDGLNPTTDIISGATPHSDISQNNTLNLVKITSSDAIVNFNLEDRSDLIGEADIDTIANNGTTSTKRLKSVDIYSAVTGNKIKTFQFNYSYFPYSTIGGSYVNLSGSQDVLGLRLRLDSLTEIGYLPNGATQNLPPYKFVYDNTTTLPLKTSFARDFWGYYNGQNNTGFIPDLSFFYFNRDSLYTSVPGYLMDSMFFNNRAPDSISMMADMLKQITYPTGGFSQFDYSPNSFSNHYYPDQAKINATLKQTFVRDMNLGLPYDTLSRAFQIKRNTLVHFDCQINAGDPQQGLTFSQMQGAYIILQKQKLDSGILTTLQTWQMQSSDQSTFNSNNGIEWTQDIELPYDPDPLTYYVVTASLPNSLGPQNLSTKNAYVQCNYEYFDTTNNPLQRSLGGGVRVSDIRNYNTDGGLINQKVIRYVNTDSSTSGLLMSPLWYYYSTLMYFLNAVSANENGIPLVESDTSTTWFISSESAVPFSNAAGGNIVGYSRVEETELAPDGTTNGIHVYEYNNIPSEVQVRLPDNPHLVNGLISRETILTSNLDSVSSTTYNYTDLGSIPYNGIKIFSAFIGLNPCQLENVAGVDDNGASLNGWDFGNYYNIPTEYNILYYPVNTDWYMTQQKVTRYYGNGKLLTDTTTNSYNSLGQTSTATSFNSKGQKQVIQSTYPIDSASSSGSLVQAMKDNSRYNNLLVRTTSLNDTETERMNIYYYYNNTTGIAQIVPSSVQLSYKQAPLFTDITYDSYGLNDNVQQATKRGSTTSLLWDVTNNRIIAEANNAYFSDIAYTSFEQDGAVNWFMGSGSRSIGGLSGSQYYQLNSDITSNSLTPGTIYIVSYWTQNTTPFTIPGTINGYPLKGKTITINNSSWTLYTHKVAGQSYININGTGPIDELRLYPSTAQMTTYTYSPLVGMTSQTDVGNRVTYYEYDGLARLKRIRDQDYNILKTYEYQYQVPAGCSGCQLLAMETFLGTNTSGYPVGVFDIHGNLVGNAAGASAYVSLWNSDTADARVGALSTGNDSLHFNIVLNTGQTLPASVTGCRYFQVDLAYTNIDGIRNFNGTYVDFGDGTGMHLGTGLLDTPAVIAPNTTHAIQAVDVGYTTYPGVVYDHSYPNSSQKTLTFYHNDAAERSDFDNLYAPAPSLTQLKNLRGNLPINTPNIGGSCYQQSTMSSVANITNWSSIHSIQNFRLNNGDNTNPCENIGYAQDFLAGDPGLISIMTAWAIHRPGNGDSTFKLARLKSNWNTYFTQLQSIAINEDDWNHEDLSGLTNLRLFQVIASGQVQANGSSQLVPLDSTEIDNIINQIAAGAGQVVTNGTIGIVTGGSNRTSNSTAAYNFLVNTRGWNIVINTTAQ